MKAASVRIEQLLADHQAGQSDLQIERFVALKGHWTTYGQYKQCLREIDSRHASLQELREEVELLKLDLRAAGGFLQRHQPGQPEYIRGRIRRDRQQRRMQQLQRTIAEQDRELQRFVAIASELKQRIGELTPERRAELDAELWSVRVRAMVALDLFTSGQLSPATAELLIALPAEIRQPILADARNPMRKGGLFDWLEHGPHRLPAPAPVHETEPAAQSTEPQLPEIEAG